MVGLAVVVHGAGGDGERAAEEVVHEVEVGPGGGGAEAVGVGAEALAELLHLVAALEGGLGGGVGEVIAATGGHCHGDLLPLGGLELAAVEGVPFLLVGFDQMDRLLVGPGDGLGLLTGGLGRGRHGRGERREERESGIWD